MEIGSTANLPNTPRSGPRALLGVLAAFALLVSAVATVGRVAATRGEGAGAGTATGASGPVRLPLAFEPNRGQTHGAVDFLARSSDAALFLTPTEAVMAFEGEGAGRDVVRMRLVGSDAEAEARGVSRLPGTVNYLQGGDPDRWMTGIPTYGRVRYADVYPGVDVVYRGAAGALRYDFVVAPNADPSSIELRFVGARSVSTAPNGDLLVATDRGVLRQSAPRLFQWVDGKASAVRGAFALRDGGGVGFSIGAYDRGLPLVIDPTVSYGTYLGGSGFDITFGVAVDSGGNAYVAGHTASLNFPTSGSVSCQQPFPPPTPPASPTSSYQCNPDGAVHDAFVAKINPTGTALVYSTYLGGTGFDQAWDVAVDAGGNAYVVGATDSFDRAGTAENDGFPTTRNAYDRTCGTDGRCNRVLDERLTDVFVAKLSAGGSRLLYSTYLGGSDFDQQTQVTALPSEMAIAVRGKTAYVVGSTGSTNFPTTRNGDRSCGLASVPGCDDGGRDAFLSAIDTSRSGRRSLRFSSYLGGTGTDEARGVGVDDAGNAYVVGSTWGYAARRDRTVNNFPTTRRALSTRYGGGEADAFAVKVNPRAEGWSEALVYSTYLGGGGKDQAWDVAVTSPSTGARRGRGSAYVVGFTDSGDDPATPEADGISPYFPVTAGAFDTTYNGQHTQADFSNQFLNGDAFAVKLRPSGRSLAYGTFLGGVHHDVAAGVAVDSAGRAYVTGYTTCDSWEEGDPPCEGTYPVTEDAPFPDMNGNFPPNNSRVIMNVPTDGFATKLAADGGSLVYSTYLPAGDHFDRGFGVAVRDRDETGAEITPEAYFVGRTNSSDLPTSSTVLQPAHGGGGRDGYVIKLQG